MAGGGSETQTSTIEIPQWLQEAAQSGLARGQQAAGIGYVPYRGPDVAALTPLQEAAMFNTSQASSAFGLGASPLPGAGMPTVQTFADGTRGYSAFPLYEQAVNDLRMRDPAQYAKLMAPFSGGDQFGITSMPMGGPMGGTRSYGQALREGPAQGSSASRSTKYDTYNSPAAAAARAAAGSRGTSGMSSYLPGGVNTRNPLSAVNQAAARLTSKPQGAPTAASRPKASPVAKTSAPKPASKAAPTKKTAEKKSSPSRGGSGRR